MSLSIRCRCDRPGVRVTTLALVVLSVLWLGVPGAAATASRPAGPVAPTVPAGPAAVPLPGVTVLPTLDRQVSVVVDVSGAAQPVLPQSISVSAAGVRQPAVVVPVVSDSLAVGLVVDASQTGAGQTESWLSGAARFVLEAPAGAREAVVADTTPPAVLAPLRHAPADLVGALSGVQPHGKRQTSQALTLAVRQLPGSPTGPRAVVLYTAAPDAGGETSGDLATRLARQHVLLVVVSTAPDTRYWSAATGPTGGFLAPSSGSASVPAFDQVAATLKTRYLISFPPPAQVPTRVSVQVELPDVTMAADVTVPGATDATTQPRHGGLGAVPWMTVLLWTGVIVSALALLVGTVVRLR